jgi:hypothetical protein
VDTKQLSPGDRDKLAVLVRRAGLLHAPAAPAEPDRFTYAVTVEDEGQRHADRAHQGIPSASARSRPVEARK